MKTAPEAFTLLPMEALEHAAECLRIIAHPHRLRMLDMLVHGRFTVGELAEACGISSSVASDHLRLMRRCRLLASERDGRRTYYTISEMHLRDLLACVRSRFGSTA